MRDPMEILEDRLSRHRLLWSLYLAFNFCKPEYADGTAKVDGPLFRLFKRVFYLECSCCAAVRGLLAGFLLGLAAGVLICLT